MSAVGYKKQEQEDLKSWEQKIHSPLFFHSPMQKFHSPCGVNHSPGQ